MKKRRRLLALFSFVIVLGILGANIHDEKPHDAVATEASNPYTAEVEPGDLKDGVYRASGEGFIDDITVEMVVENGNISLFRVIEHNETSQISKTALTTIPYQIEKEKSTKVDVISGATETSKGIIQAARACIRQAGGNPDDY